MLFEGVVDAVGVLVRLACLGLLPAAALKTMMVPKPSSTFLVMLSCFSQVVPLLILILALILTLLDVPSA